MGRVAGGYSTGSGSAGVLRGADLGKNVNYQIPETTVINIVNPDTGEYQDYDTATGAWVGTGEAGARSAGGAESRAGASNYNAGGTAGARQGAIDSSVGQFGDWEGRNQRLSNDPGLLEGSLGGILGSLADVATARRRTGTANQATSAALPYLQAALAGQLRRDEQSDAQRQWNLGVDTANQRAYGDPRRALAGLAAPQIAIGAGLKGYDDALAKYAAPNMPDILRDRLEDEERDRLRRAGSAPRTGPSTGLVRPDVRASLEGDPTTDPNYLKNPFSYRDQERPEQPKRGFWGNVGNFAKGLAVPAGMILASKIPGGNLWGKLGKVALGSLAQRISGGQEVPFMNDLVANELDANAWSNQPADNQWAGPTTVSDFRDPNLLGGRRS